MKKIQIKLLIGCALQILMGSELSANPDLDDVDIIKHVAHYNSLPAVEESDAKLKTSAQFTSFLKRAEEVVTRYELETYIGLRLIHRHFTLGNHQVMAEEFKEIDRTPSLVTSAHDLENAKAIKAVPSSWIYSNKPSEVVQLFESSTDSAIKAGNSLLDKSPDFIDEMGALLREDNLTDLLSVAILKRKSLKASKDQVYTEINSVDPNKSVVQLWDLKKQSDKAIRTAWSFKSPQEQICIPLWSCSPTFPGEWHHFITIAHAKIDIKE